MAEQTKGDWVDVPSSDSDWVDAKDTSASSSKGVSGTTALAAATALRALPAIAAGAKALATPENFGRVSAVSGFVKAGHDLYNGHPIDAIEHAVYGVTPSVALKVVKSLAANAPKPASTLEYAKAAGENLKPENIIANPQVGGAVDKFADSMGQRVARVLGPNGEVVSSAAEKVPSVVSKVAAPLARALPFVQAISGGQSLTEMADNPGRKDNGFLGIGIGGQRSDEEKKAHPALINAAINALLARLRGQ